jgi:DNA polymerase III alpha subunit
MGRSFVLRHLGREQPVLPHPRLTFLRETYGVMIYQEDVMRTLSAVAGFTLAEADLMRRAMSFKGNPEEFLALKDRFLAGARRIGAEAEVGSDGIAELWRQISSFGGYAFCKAHSASYAVLSFQAAWLKAHYPAEFMAAVLDNGGGYYSRAVYLEEARRLGLGILLPDVNRSEAGFTGRDGAVRIGLGQVGGLSQRGLERILEARAQGGPFTSLDDLLARAPGLTRAEVDNLIRCGACDALGPTRPELLWRHALLRQRQSGTLPGQRHHGGSRAPGATCRPTASREDASARGAVRANAIAPVRAAARGASVAREAGSGAGATRDGRAQDGDPEDAQQGAGARPDATTAPTLFPLPPPALPRSVAADASVANDADSDNGGGGANLVPGLRDFDDQEKLRQEMEVLHVTASGHPLAPLRPELRRRGIVAAAELSRLAGRRVRIVGMLATAKSAAVHKTGERMKFLTLEDETALCEVTLFPKVYRRYGKLLLTRGPYLVTGRVENDHGAISVTAERVELL